MLIAFKKGQEKYEADTEDEPVRLWIAGVLDDLKNGEKHG